ncbi:hypothetical protein GWK47_039408 [Chionoecetes opilio]|uniref:Uncharacterized protein n=1 Tax=Chionoecetes opilio TaxID=41210 RepID=A0A8J5CXS4_CHIOP|nr:hypothetical protein GWK47_039408 [Chionoecetes opilio]
MEDDNLQPCIDQALKKLRSKSPSRASAIRAADGLLVSDMDGQMSRWAEYFGQFFTERIVGWGQPLGPPLPMAKLGQWSLPVGIALDRLVTTATRAQAGERAGKGESLEDMNTFCAPAVWKLSTNHPLNSRELKLEKCQWSLAVLTQRSPLCHLAAMLPLLKPRRRHLASPGHEGSSPASQSPVLVPAPSQPGSATLLDFLQRLRRDKTTP